MVAVLLCSLAAAVLQLGIALHVRNTVIDAASEGARYGALKGNTPEDGVQRTIDLVHTALGDQFEIAASADTTNLQGGAFIVVTAKSSFPIFGLFGAAGELEASAHAVSENE